MLKKNEKNISMNSTPSFLLRITLVPASYEFGYYEHVAFTSRIFVQNEKAFQ